MLMLFEPGKATAPSACCAAGSVRASTYFGTTHFPRAACVARLLEELGDRSAVACGNERACRGERIRVSVDLGEQRVAIGERDVAPHLRRACRDAREVAEAARGVVEIRRRVGTRGELGDEREREHVRQVRDRREDRVVAFRREGIDSRAARLPHRGDAGQRVAIRSGQRREYHAAVVEQSGKRRGGAAVLGSRDGMAGDERMKPRAERLASRGDHVLLRAAGVGHASARTEMGRELREQRRELRDRRRNEHDVRVVSLRGPRLVERSRTVDDLAFDRGVEIGPRAAHADDFAHGVGALQGQRAGASDETDADDEELSQLLH